MTSKPSLTLVRRLKADPAKVYAAWTDPQLVARWFGPAQGRILSAEADARVGGRFRIVLLGGNGEKHDVSGIYREVEADRKLVFSWAWISTPERESLVTVTIRPVEDGAELTLLHEQFFDEAARDSHRGGWNEALDNLQRFLA